MKVSELIKVGDEIRNCEDIPLLVTSAVPGRYGLLVKGRFDDEDLYEAFAPYELAASQCMADWRGWSSRAHLVLPNRMWLGTVSLWRSDSRDTIEEYDAMWEETLELMSSGAQ